LSPLRGESRVENSVRQAIAAASPVARRKAQRAAPLGAGTGDVKRDRLFNIEQQRF
jgi:hypothetical protein